MDTDSFNNFENGSFKVMYVYSAPDLETHKGLLKIGDATLHTDESLEEIIASSVTVDGNNGFYTSEKILEAAKSRIGEQTNTSGLRTKIEMAVLAVKRNSSDDEWITFRDHDFHNFLKRYGVERVSPFEGSKAREWFRVDLDSVKKFLKAFQKNEAPENRIEEKISIVLRPEQQTAVDKALENFKKTARRGEPDIMLWACIMRFGKTLTAYELIKQHPSINKVLILTHRPAVLSGWYADFLKSHMDEDGYLFGSKRLGNDWSLVKDSERCVWFMSIQDGRGSFNRDENITEVSEVTENLSEVSELQETSNIQESSNISELSEADEDGFEAEADSFEDSDSKVIEKAVDEEASKIFSKNSEIFETDWDLIIIDEGHEGFRTQLAEKTLDKLKRKYELHLSGTPYNISDRFSEEQTYRFDYSDEQKMKKRFVEEHPDEPSPYADRPDMEIYGYHLNEVRGYENHIDEGTDRVNFSKLFATVPVKNAFGGETGDYDFVDENIVFDLLDLISKNNRHSGDPRHFPFENVESKRRFAHTFWMVPNIPAAIALKKLLKNHNFFEDFKIVNATGDNWKKDFPHAQDSLSAVQKAIKENDKTITLSVGQLTTGVTVPEWTAVFMLNNTVSATNYMQTIFRSKSSGTLPDGRVKDKAFVFDFNPDRVLEIYQEIADSRSAEKKTNGDSRSISEIQEEELTELLNGIPVMFTEGDRFKRVDFMKAQRDIHRIQSSIVAQNGMDSDKIIDIPKLYSAFNADDEYVTYFKNLNGKVGGSQKFKVPAVELNTGSNNPTVPEDSENSKNDENSENLSEDSGNSGNGEDNSDDSDGLTEDQKRLEKERKKAENDRRKNVAAAKSTLRAVAIRLPFLIMALVFEKPSSEITLKNLPELVDDESWSEFMPAGFSKYGENEASWEFCEQFFDEAIFAGACERIQQRAIRSKTLRISERIPEIVRIVGTFKNPDKETVLTPWRVVNLQVAKTLGGFRWMDDEGKWICENGESLSDEELRETDKKITGEWVSQDSRISESSRKSENSNNSNISNSTRGSNNSNTSNSSRSSNTFESLEKFWNSGSSLKIFEINSKTAQYPLYMAYSIFHKLTDGSVLNKTVEDMMWKTVVENCIFVNARTPYAAKFAEVVLGGEKPGDVRVNTSVVDILKVREIFRKEKVKMDDDDWKVLWEWFFAPTEFSKASEKFEKILEISRSSEIQEIVEDSRSLESSRSSENVGISKVSEIQEVDSMDGLNDGGVLVTAKERLLKVLEEARAFNEARNDESAGTDGEPIFDAVVSNPPYQMSFGGDNQRAKPIWQDFLSVANDLSEQISIISPARWRFAASSKDKEIKNELSSMQKNVRKFMVFDPSEEIFPGTLIRDGVGIIHIDNSSESDDLTEYYLNDDFVDEKDLSESFYDSRIVDIFNKVDLGNISFLTYTNFCPGQKELRVILSDSTYEKTEENTVRTISVFGGLGSPREWKYVSPKAYSKNDGEFLKIWKLGNLGIGVDFGEKAYTLSPNEGFGERCQYLTFNSKDEAENCRSYFRTDFVKAMLLTTQQGRGDSTSELVPDLSSVTNPRTGKIGWESDWTDADLKEIFKNILTDEDWFYIEETALKSDGGRK